MLEDRGISDVCRGDLCERRPDQRAQSRKRKERSKLIKIQSRKRKERFKSKMLVRTGEQIIIISNITDWKKIVVDDD